ncbi:GTPase [uncultured Succiniclasticum sp.]|uniref:GTPase n=1 Tax=uncultured Succiniclasticum sp. TaxID=1500547 RepID=UPI0025D0472F|nr:GTPase [uncultured Succiniclasticum sp.]
MKGERNMDSTSYAEELYNQALKYWYGFEGEEDRELATVLFKKAIEEGYCMPAYALKMYNLDNYVSENLKSNLQNEQDVNRRNSAQSVRSKYSGNSLEDALEECRNSSEKGFKIAMKNEAELRVIIKAWNKEVEKAKNNIPIGSNSSDSYKSYLKELEKTKEDLQKLCDQTRKNFIENADRLQNFTITVFGKTMAGKSTLMEVLREGDGSSIGKGTQRTTKDVRSYPWKKTGIKFYDVPGIASAKHGGEDDSRIAFEAVEYADLVLFLITDDSVQPEEAEWLSKIRKKGKPVICILNVKACGVNAAKSFEQRVRMVKRKFTNDKERLDAIKKQFLAFADLDAIKQDWSDLPFWYVDLHTAWLSQQDKEHSKELYALSNFKQVEDEIIAIVKSKGAFYQYKTFIDNIYEGIWNTRARLLEQGNNHKRKIPLVLDNRDKLSILKRELRGDNATELKDFVDSFVNELKQKLPGFVEYHYNDKNCGAAWEKLLRQLEIDAKIKNFVKGRDKYIETRLQEFCSDFVNELRLADKLGDFSVPFRGESITDFKFGVEVAGSLAAIGTAILINPIIGIGVAIGSKIISWLFDSKEEKIQEAQHKLKEALKFWIDGSGSPDSKTRETFEKAFYSSLRDSGVESFYGPVNFKTVLMAILEKTVYRREELYFDTVDNAFNEFVNAIQDLYTKESNLANKLKNNLSELNQELISSAFVLTGIDARPLSIERVLGIKVEMCLSDSSIEADKIKYLNELLQEKVVVK